MRDLCAEPELIALLAIQTGHLRAIQLQSIVSGNQIGILDQQIWTREPQKRKKKKTQKTRNNILEKESKRWLTGLVQAELAIPATTTVVTITDTEGDIYDLFALEREPNSHLLIRAKHNRRINHELKFVQEAIAQTPASGQLSIVVPRKDNKPSRTASLSVRYATFSFSQPSRRRRK